MKTTGIEDGDIQVLDLWEEGDGDQDVRLYKCKAIHRTPTLPHSFGNRQGAVADSRNGAGNGPRLYEVNIWKLRYGRGQPRLVTVAEAELQRMAAISDARRREIGRAHV